MVAPGRLLDMRDEDEMGNAETLRAVAEVATPFAGFAGIVVAQRRNSIVNRRRAP